MAKVQTFSYAPCPCGTGYVMGYPLQCDPADLSAHIESLEGVDRIRASSEANILLDCVGLSLDARHTDKEVIVEMVKGFKHFGITEVSTREVVDSWEGPEPEIAG